MKNIGKQINELMKAQGYDHTDYGRVSSWSTKNGLDLHLWTYTSANQPVSVNRNEDGTYHIVTNLALLGPSIVKDNIAEDVLFETFAAEMVSLAP